MNELRKLMTEPGAREALDSLVPEHLRNGLWSYATQGVRPGQFLCAMIDCDFHGVISRVADGLTIADLRGIHQWLYNYTTSECWGDRAKRFAWERAHGRGDPPDDDDEEEIDTLPWSPV